MAPTLIVGDPVVARSGRITVCMGAPLLASLPPRGDMEAVLVSLVDDDALAALPELPDEYGQQAGHLGVAHGLSLRREAVEAGVADVEGGGVEV